MKRKPEKRKIIKKSHCKTCDILLKQLDAAEVREKRLMRQLESKDEQIGMVITNKFESFHTNGPTPESDISTGLPAEALSGVPYYDDSQKFVEEAQNVLHPDKTH